MPKGFDFDVREGLVNVLKRRFFIALILILFASLLPDILLRELTGQIPALLPYVKLVVLVIVFIICLKIDKLKEFSDYSLILAVIIATEILTKTILASEFWLSKFDHSTFVGNFGSSILLKLVAIVPIILALFATLRVPSRFYLCKGDLSVKADKIFGIVDKNRISWGKLAMISAILISLGTFLLILVTVTGFSRPEGMDRFLSYLPLIILLALVNSFAEGIVFRHSILGTLTNKLPKEQVILIAAIFFGLAHYYGAPSGIIGVIMSCLLGWYLCRAKYETGGFVAPWIIHFAQDVVIFSSLILFGGWV